jgi:hypothetical protein
MHRFRLRLCQAFTTAELLVSMAVAALAFGAVAVAFGSYSRIQPRVASRVTLKLPSTHLPAYYGLTGETVRETSVAPNYGVLAKAEMLRERFLADTLSATAVFCLSRSQPNNFHPRFINYEPSDAISSPLDSQDNFRAYLVNESLVMPGVFHGAGNATTFHSPLPVPAVSTGTTAATYNYGASIFVIGFSPYVDKLVVTAVYDIDVDKVSLPSLTTGRARGGFYASVKRWAYDEDTDSINLSDFYDVFYPPSKEGQFNEDDEEVWPTTSDQFAPLWVAFERRTRRTGIAATDRFRIAIDMPFYLIWWPDPAARNLAAQRSLLQPAHFTEARNVYYHMAGRTAFMFTVPMFPAS